jgi:Cys-tRNA(Pro)/Cys-tRNA(Cys) deacylase
MVEQILNFDRRFYSFLHDTFILHLSNSFITRPASTADICGIIIQQEESVSITNNVTRMLDAQKVSYTAFDTPAEKLGAVETAQFLNVPVEIVFKTVVISRILDKPSAGKKKPILAVIPGNHVVDLKLLADEIGEKKVHLPTEKEAEQITGLQAGGISPLALINKGFQVIVDESARTLGSIHISGGQRGLNILLPVDDLLSLTQARFGRISVPAN